MGKKTRENRIQSNSTQDNSTTSDPNTQSLNNLQAPVLSDKKPVNSASANKSKSDDIKKSNAIFEANSLISGATTNNKIPNANASILQAEDTKTTETDEDNTERRANADNGASIKSTFDSNEVMIVNNKSSASSDNINKHDADKTASKTKQSKIKPDKTNAKANNREDNTSASDDDMISDEEEEEEILTETAEDATTLADANANILQGEDDEEGDGEDDANPLEAYKNDTNDDMISSGDEEEEEAINVDAIALEEADDTSEYKNEEEEEEEVEEDYLQIKTVAFDPQEHDVVSTKLRSWNLRHPGNLAYADLLAEYASKLPSTTDPNYSSILSE